MLQAYKPHSCSLERLETTGLLTMEITQVGALAALRKSRHKMSDIFRLNGSSTVEMPAFLKLPLWLSMGSCTSRLPMMHMRSMRKPDRYCGTILGQFPRA